MREKSEGSKLLTLYNSLNKTEKVQLRKFILSPFHNKHPKVTELFELMRKVKLDKEPMPSNEEIFNHLYPEKPYDDLKLRHLKSILFQKMEHFLGYSRIGNYPPLLQLKVMEDYQSRGLDKHFSGALRTARKQMKKQSLPDLEQHFYQFQNELAAFDSGVQRNKNPRNQLQKISDELDIYYFSIKLKAACSLLAHQQVFMSTLHLPMVSEVIEQIERRNLKLIPAIGIYYHIYMAHTSGEVEMHFPNVQRLLKEWEDQFEVPELRSLYNFAINICEGQLKLGQQEYLRQKLDLYQSALRAGVMLDNGVLSPWTYKKIVATGLELQDLDWTEGFIKEYKPLLPESHRESFYQNSLAKLYFTRRQFHDAAKVLETPAGGDPFIELDSRVIKIKSFFEMKNLARVEDQLNIFEKFLQRKKTQTDHRINFSNFINFTHRTMELGTGDELRRARLIADINSAEILSEREWLLEKLF